jgi:hypothetical protein
MECNKAGYKFFAREWRGQCFCGNEVCMCVCMCCMYILDSGDCIIYVLLLMFWFLLSFHQINRNRDTISMDLRPIAIVA